MIKRPVYIQMGVWDSKPRGEISIKSEQYNPAGQGSGWEKQEEEVKANQAPFF